ncbi:DHA2 family efflux MFS transporter permease subunit [Hansschlegelia plantiphila]|uniref:MFS transporter n=1 Tax=Hansschlegelia plantiphila TaxID=374655 RepID=A0A9W6MX00_9HYPH|nr:DHA2 family efflux MFS transporter permease subunit [Hansschlegelia plantiphila]GLK69400.1 MFS transporter [Hansschlegelia plantiphila]
MAVFSNVAIPNRILVPLIVACALFMENLDSTVLATSLPAIATELGVNPIDLKLAMTSYLLSLAVFIPVSGWVADRFGARLVFRTAIAVFALGSALAGFSATMPEMIGARVIQGVGGAMMVPVGRLVILRTVPKSELVGSLAWLTVPALIGPVLGPPLGGFITTYFSWRWIFWINLPIAALGLVLATLFIPDLKGEERTPFDRLGFVLSGFGLAALVSGATALGLEALPHEVAFVLLAAGVVSLAGYILHFRRVEHPILDLRLFAIPTFRAAILGGSLFRIGIGAAPFLLPLMLQLGFGLSAFQSGLLTFASALGALFMKMAAKPILQRFGFRATMIANALIAAAFMTAPALFTAATPSAVMLGALLVGGFFRSLQFTAVNALGYADIDSARMSRATSLASVAQQISLSLGVSFAALALEAILGHRAGTTLQASDFPPTFMMIGLISASSVFLFARLAPNAGGEVSGHAPAGPDPLAEARERG